MNTIGSFSSNSNTIKEVLPKKGLLYIETQELDTLVLCKPKILPIKSLILQRLQQLEREILARPQTAQPITTRGTNLLAPGTTNPHNTPNIPIPINSNIGITMTTGSGSGVGGIGGAMGINPSLGGTSHGINSMTPGIHGLPSSLSSDVQVNI